MSIKTMAANSARRKPLLLESGFALLITDIQGFTDLRGFFCSTGFGPRQNEESIEIASM
ncbi:hypothetical protein [Thiolapillus sp.]